MPLTNLFIVGAPKCGTTTLHDLLNSQENIEMSIVKEPHFFCEDLTRKIPSSQKRKKRVKYKNGEIQKRHFSYIESIEIYRSLWLKPDQTFYGEGSTSYLYSKKAPEEIFKYNPESKIIIVLRDPYDRCLSHIKADKLRGRFKIEELLIDIQNLENDLIWGKDPGYIRLSLYSKNIERFARVFPTENLLILPFKLLNNSEKLQDVLTKFLAHPVTIDDIIHSNKSDKRLITYKKYIREFRRFLKINWINPSAIKTRNSMLEKNLKLILNDEINSLLDIEVNLIRDLEKKYEQL